MHSLTLIFYQLLSDNIILLSEIKLESINVRNLFSEFKNFNQDFIQDIEESGVDEMDICSFYAKLCYKSLALGHNNNISRTRSIAKNFINCIESGHGSVMEHATLNFVAENDKMVHRCTEINDTFNKYS